MDALQAHDLFTAWTPEQRKNALPGSYCVNTPGGPIDCWPAFAAAAVVLSGFLPTMAPEELADALHHFRVMFENGVYNWDDWESEARAVLLSLIEWGEEVDADDDRPRVPAFGRN